jgi:ATPases of the AAA+ class
MSRRLEEFITQINTSSNVRRGMTVNGERTLPTVPSNSPELTVKKAKDGDSKNCASEPLDHNSVHHECKARTGAMDESRLNIETWYRYQIPIETHSDQSSHLILESQDKLKQIEIPAEIRFPTDKDFLQPEGENEQKPAGVRYVAGLEEEKTQIRRFLSNVPSEWGLTPERGLLLKGPPGSGKTRLITEVCKEQFGSIPVVISGPEILSRWVGESERLLREKFTEARSRDSRVLYIDEIDSIARSRSGATQDHSAQLVAQLLVLLDGVRTDDSTSSHPVQVIASTNIADALDDALTRPGRFGETIKFGLLHTERAYAVLHHYIEQIWQSSRRDRLSDELIEFVTSGRVPREILGSFTEEYTGAEIEGIVRHAIKQMGQVSNSSNLSLTSEQLVNSASTVRKEYQTKLYPY